MDISVKNIRKKTFSNYLQTVNSSLNLINFWNFIYPTTILCKLSISCILTEKQVEKFPLPFHIQSNFFFCFYFIYNTCNFHIFQFFIYIGKSVLKSCMCFWLYPAYRVCRNIHTHLHTYIHDYIHTYKYTWPHSVFHFVII